MIQAYIALGGNRGEVLPTLKQAIKQLESCKEIYNLKCSHFYRTAPVEAEGEEWFVNTVCSLFTTLKPLDLFLVMQQIEQILGKVNKAKEAPRPIDLDLLFYGTWKGEEEGLTIPHPRWTERLFVLIPLLDLISEIRIADVSYYLPNLITPLMAQAPASVILLEKNPHLS